MKKALVIWIYYHSRVDNYGVVIQVMQTIKCLRREIVKVLPTASQQWI